MTYWATAEGVPDHLGPFATEEEALVAARGMGRVCCTVYEANDDGES